MTPDSSPTSRRIPCLDGLRAVSIGLVLVSHLYGTRGFPQAPHWFRLLGALGVSVFFVISGFLITSLLAREHDRTGAIDVRAFYLRRVLRIFPAYYALLGVVALLAFAGVVRPARGELLASLTYTRNFFSGGSWWTGHAWSLAIEEQFYLLWPAVLLYAGPRRGARVAAVVVVVAPVLRLVLASRLPPAQRPMIDWYTFSRIDTILLGCVLALWHREPWFERLAHSFARAGGPWLALLAIAASVYLRRYAPYDLVASYSVEGVAAALLLHWCITHERSRAGRVLDSAPFRWVGELSYGLYLWQQLFLQRTSDAWLHRFPVNLALAAGVALASRALIERPFLRLKLRVSSRTEAPVAVPSGARASVA